MTRSKVPSSNGSGSPGATTFASSSEGLVSTASSTSVPTTLATRPRSIRSRREIAGIGSTAHCPRPAPKSRTWLSWSTSALIRV